MQNELFSPLIIGFLLDCLLGDPRWLPHPIRAFGWLINKGETQLNKGNNKKLKGAILSLILISGTFVVLIAIETLTANQILLHKAFASVFVFYGLANRSLIAESLKVEKTLTQQGLEAGRKQLSFIVGRETKTLNENQIRTAVLETMAENLSDGVVAPLFYYALGGFPLMLAYKMANTLDSMIGYKSDRYLKFGWFAAKFDDLINYIPARITAFIMVLITFNWRGLIFIFKFGHKHASPNAGYPEAALAGILNCRFGGPNYYHGQLVSKPFIGQVTRSIHKTDVIKTATINFAVALFTVLAIFFLR